MTRTERLSAAIRTVREAATVIGAPTRPRRARPKASVADVRTSTGRRVERPIRGRLAAHLPGDAVVGEEGDGPAPFDRDRPTRFTDSVDGATGHYRGIPMAARSPAVRDGRARQSGDDTTVAGDGLVHDAVPARPTVARPTAVRSAGGVVAR
ncbi:hypothetical protein ACIRFH_29485 [Streptomyces sp. NPDC093586]|uniref:hypothetical protein n=1 Tax=Streptomyces sp. NPDC093586 TaxID=3366042 RepID=UPI00381B28CA